MKVPEEVKVAAKSLVDRFGCHFRHLGERDGADFYMFIFTNHPETGLPFVYEYRDGEVREHRGYESLDIIGLFGDDVGDICEE